jgi:membrane-associated phospholipid phosphatase
MLTLYLSIISLPLLLFSASKLIMFSIWIPITLMSIIGLVGKRSFHVSVKGISSLLLAVGGSEGTTQLLKTWVLRRRPNFYHLCQFSSETLACQGDYHSILESQMSFPSGHSSLSWCGMVVLVWFLIMGNKQTFGKVYMFVCTVLPLGAATFVASSRIVDHWHHPSDVLTGVFLGCVWGTIGYHVHDSVKPPSPISLTATAPSIKLPSFHE